MPFLARPHPDLALLLGQYNIGQETIAKLVAHRGQLH